MLRDRLRTLLILLALLPPLLWIGWGKYQAWKAERERQARQPRYHELLRLREPDSIITVEGTRATPRCPAADIEVPD